MPRMLGVFCLFVIIPLLASCGVPRLYSPLPSAARSSTAPPTDATANLSPKVADIVDEIECEIGGANARQLASAPYTVQVLLNLEVDDAADVTPSITLINPLASAGTVAQMETNTLGLDVGGARMRTFTTTYYLDSTKLPAACGAKRDQRKLYNLAGSLGLFEIARDGAGVLAKTDTEKQTADKKLIPTFGSTIQFTVTKSVTALGPLWTLKRFKGPSDKNGLVNGKRVNVDKAVFIFTPQPGRARQLAASAVVADSNAALGEAKTRTTAAAQRVGHAAAARGRIEAQLHQLKARDRIQAFQLNQSLTDASEEERSAREDLATRSQ